MNILRVLVSIAVLLPASRAVSQMAPAHPALPDTVNGRPESLGFLDFGDATTLDLENPRPLVFIGERLMSGRREAIYRSGTLFLDDAPWLPSPVSPRQAAFRARTDSIIGTTVPLVRKLVGEGTPLRDAVVTYERRVRANLDTVTVAYRRSLEMHDRNAAALVATARIDTAIAVADLGSPGAPRFGFGGGVSLFFTGKGWMYRHAGSLLAARSAAPFVTSRHDAQSEVGYVRGKLLEARPEVLFYPTSGHPWSYDEPRFWREVAGALLSGEISEPFDEETVMRIIFRAKRKLMMDGPRPQQ